MTGPNPYTLDVKRIFDFKVEEETKVEEEIKPSPSKGNLISSDLLTASFPKYWGLNTRKRKLRVHLKRPPGKLPVPLGLKKLAK